MEPPPPPSSEPIRSATSPWEEAPPELPKSEPKGEELPPPAAWPVTSSVANFFTHAV